MNTSLHDQIIALLKNSAAPFRLVTHAPTRTSEDAARERGEPLGCGAKALLVKADGAFRLLIIPADRKLDSRLARKNLNVRELRFATVDELAAVIGVPPGAVPPFGQPLVALPLAADPDVGRRYPQVAFNAASLTTSIVMAAADWERVAKPQRIPLTTSAPESPSP
jgi:Ala-tRNA(Pro) deacylase